MAFSVEPGEPRTNETLRHQDKGFHHCYTDLQKLKLDLIKKIPLDYLHFICFGVMKKLLMTWSGLDKVKFNRKARLRPLQREKISQLLHHLRQYTPLEFARRPRFLQELKKWKATEFRQFLLYTGPMILKKILPEKHYKNFMKLHVAIKILATPKMCIDYNELAQRLITFFVKDCKDLYGKRFICYNIHSLLHLSEDVMTFGHLESFSTFPFENHLRLYKPMIRKGEFVLVQVVTRIMEMKTRSLDFNFNKTVIEHGFKYFLGSFGCFSAIQRETGNRRQSFASIILQRMGQVWILLLLYNGTPSILKC